MNGVAWEGGRPSGTNDHWPLLAMFVTFGAIATIAAAIVSNGSLPATLAPTLIIGILATVWVVPVRLPLFALTFLALAVDGPGDAQGIWKSPFNWLGLLLTWNLNKTIPVEALTVPVMTLLLLYLWVVRGHRWVTRSRIDELDNVVPFTPMFLALGVSALTVAALCVNGVRRAGDIQMAKIQVQTFLQVLLMAYLLATSMRGVRDYRVLGRVIVAAACSKALMALWVWFTIAAKLATRTSHGDSMLFSCATAILVATFVERPTNRSLLKCGLFLPLIVAGMVVNSRRIVWLEVLTMVIMLALVSRRTRLKVAATRLVLLALPLVVLYGLAGWNSNAQFFAPVRTLRSVGDADIDGSTLYRDIENYNLLATIRLNPLVGTGFGQPYMTAVQNADISFFKEWLYLPHNSVLGLWGVGGLIGFTGLGSALIVAMFLSARRYFESESPVERAAAFAALTSVAIYLIHCWGDIGFSEMRSIFLVGPALAIAGQVSVAHESLASRRSARVS